MNILFISDIHANLEALVSLESHIKSADLTICLGDMVGYNCHVNETIDLLKYYDVKCIQGNHDYYLIEGLDGLTKEINDSVRFGIEIAKKKITPNNLDWLKSLPISLGLKEDGLTILCCHGSPWNPVNEYVYEDSLLFEKMQDFKYDFIALGHIHRQYYKPGSTTIFNPGSVGQSRDREGIACAKILNTKSKSLEDIYCSYDFRKELSYSISCGAKDWIYKHFRSVL